MQFVNSVHDNKQCHSNHPTVHYFELMGAYLILTVKILLNKNFIRYFISMLTPKLLYKEQKQFHHF